MPASEWYTEGLRFSCTQCGNCCSGPPGYVWFTEDEAQAMARALKLDLTQFLRQFAHRVDGRWTLNEVVQPQGEHDCVFLRRERGTGKSLCAVYQHRPLQCRTWPFWPQNLTSPTAWIRATQRCPGMREGVLGHGKLHTLAQIRVVRDRNQ